MIIAIDGHSSCGKSSFAKRIAEELRFIYIDSGAMYRGVTLFCLENEIIKEKTVDTQKLIKLLPGIKLSFKKLNNNTTQDLFLNGENVEDKIRSMEVSSVVSEVSKIKEVRDQMVILQRRLSQNHSVVMEGRDIGTIVFPGADIKIFMTASLEVRVQRRTLELQEKGIQVTSEEVRANLAERDRIDQGREFSPLVRAKDAILLDNSEMSPDDQMIWFRKIMGDRKK